jgi:hypothetical protein
VIGALRIARLELAGRWTLWLAAVSLGLLAALIPALANDPRLGEVCMVGTVVLSWIIAFAIGMSLLGRPLHDGRLAFFFTRPVHGATIAVGKVIGGLLLVAGTQMLLLVPSLVTFRASELKGMPTEMRLAYVLESSGALFAICMTIVFLAAGLVVGILARSRSRWFILDAIGGTTAALLVVATFAQVNQAQRYAELNEWTPEQAGPMFFRIDVLMRALAITGVLVVFCAVTIAIATGRTDRDRVHRSLAITLWSSLAVAGVIGIAVAHWGLV